MAAGKKHLKNRVSEEVWLSCQRGQTTCARKYLGPWSCRLAQRMCRRGQSTRPGRVMKPGRKSFGRVRVDALDAWMMVTTKAGWKTAVSFLITLKKHENDSGPLTVSVLFRARRHSHEISQDLRSRMNLSSSVMAASTHTSFPRVRVRTSQRQKKSRGRINAPWKNECTVEESVHRGGAGNLSMACATITTGTSTTPNT